VPNIQSAKKQARQSEKRRMRNKALKTYLKNLKKKTVTIIEAEATKADEALAALKTYQSQLDKAWAKGLFKRNKSSRLVSNITHTYKKRFGEKKTVEE
jgi:small subunit ribosomal protein S20